MAQQESLERVMQSVAGREGPMFSGYLSTSADVPENQERAYLVRLRHGLDESGASEEVARRIREEVEGTQPGARTLAIFADEADFFEVHELRVDLPESFRWGAPDAAPLALALGEHEPYGAALVDAESFRYFVASPLAVPDAGAEVVAGGGYREVEVSPSSPGPRGGADQDPISRRTEANVGELFNELGELTRDVTFREGVRRLIVAGPKERTAEFRGRLPQDVADRVVAEEPVELDASDGEILDRLEEMRERAEHGRREELLAQIRESGVWGFDKTLRALQEENRVYHLVVLWELDADVRWSDADGLVIPDVTGEESPYSGEETRVRPLKDVLVDQAQARGARLEFMRGENANTDVLRDEFGGVAGLTRF